MATTSKLRITPVKLIVLGGIILILAAIYGWWTMVLTNPDHVFKRMLATNLSTPSVTKVSTQNDGSQTLAEVTQLTTTPVQQTQGSSTLGQVNDPSTVVKTESIGSPTEEYVRYTDIKTGQKNSAGKNFDFSSVLGIWGKTTRADVSTGGPQQYTQALLSVVPSANLPAAQRKTLVNQIIDSGVYDYTSSKVKKRYSGGRLVYTYDISVRPVPYVTMLKIFARDMGLRQLEAIDPAQYANSEPLTFSVDVDVWSGELTKVAYGDSNRVDAYAGYGLTSTADVPTNAISIDELQNRLQQLQ
jgi:hypothetical protein